MDILRDLTSSLSCTLIFAYPLALAHELGHAYSAKYLYETEPVIHCSILNVISFSSSVYVDYPIPDGKRDGTKDAIISAAGPLCGILACACLYGFGQFLPNGNRSIRFAINATAFAFTGVNLMELIPRHVIVDGKPTTSDGAGILAGLGFTSWKAKTA